MLLCASLAGSAASTAVSAAQKCLACEPRRLPLPAWRHTRHCLLISALLVPHVLRGKASACFGPLLAEGGVRHGPEQEHSQPSALGLAQQRGQPDPSTCGKCGPERRRSLCKVCLICASVHLKARERSFVTLLSRTAKCSSERQAPGTPREQNSSGTAWAEARGSPLGAGEVTGRQGWGMEGCGRAGQRAQSGGWGGGEWRPSAMGIQQPEEVVLGPNPSGGLDRGDLDTSCPSQPGAVSGCHRRLSLPHASLWAF